MAKFSELKAQLVKASEALRSFTLGMPGTSSKHGISAIKRVDDLCEQIKASLKQTAEIANIIHMARNQIAAANCRLKLLKSRAS